MDGCTYCAPVYAPILAWVPQLRRRHKYILAELFKPPLTLTHGDAHIENVRRPKSWTLDPGLWTLDAQIESARRGNGQPEEPPELCGVTNEPYTAADPKLAGLLRCALRRRCVLHRLRQHDVLAGRV